MSTGALSPRMMSHPLTIPVMIISLLRITIGSRQIFLLTREWFGGHACCALMPYGIILFLLKKSDRARLLS